MSRTRGINEEMKCVALQHLEGGVDGGLTATFQWSTVSVIFPSSFFKLIVRHSGSQWISKDERVRFGSKLIFYLGGTWLRYPGLDPAIY
jgi:hypothetical protein